MSQYINFYSKDNRTLIGSYSRNSKIYQNFVNEVPYERGMEMSHNELWYHIECLEGDAVAWRERIRSKFLTLSDVAYWNNPAEEKLEIIDTINHEIDEMYNEYDEFIIAIGILRNIADIAMNSDSNSVMVGIEWDGSDESSPTQEV